MKRPRRKTVVLFAGIALVLAGVAWLALRSPPEPVYQGKRVRDWARETAMNPQDAEPRLAIQKIGTDGVPWLIKGVENKPSLFRKPLMALRRVAPQSMRPRITAWLSARDTYFTQIGSARSLGLLGRGAEHAAPALCRALDSKFPPLAVEASEALGNIGPAAVPHLVEALKGKDADQLRLACYALSRIGPPAESAIPQIVRIISERPGATGLIGSAVHALTSIARDRPELLAQFAKSPQTQVRVQIAAALEGANAPGRVALPVLFDLLNDTETSVRLAAVRALGNLRPGASNVIEKLSVTLRDPDASVRAESLEALGHGGTRAALILPQITAALNDTNVTVRTAAAWCIAAIGPKAASAKPDLERLLAHEAEEARTAAKAALSSIDGKTVQSP